MNAGAPGFRLVGRYRVQGCQTPEPARLEGCWLDPRSGLLTADKMNRAITGHRRWQKQMRCSLRAADIGLRSGQFASRADVLYKTSHFEAEDGTAAMETNIVDVRKAMHLWQCRRPALEALLGEKSFESAMLCIGDTDRAIVNEYFLHEAGHCLGYSVEEKTRDRFFAPGGHTSASLIALEELRADAHGFELGLELLAPSDAASVFVYYLLQRFGVHVQGQHESGGAPYGLIPYLLFDILQEAGLHCLYGLSMQWPARPALLNCMRNMATIIDEAVTKPELLAGSPIHAAFVGGTYVRHRLLDSVRSARFQHLIDGSLARLHTLRMARSGSETT